MWILVRNRVWEEKVYEPRLSCEGLIMDVKLDATRCVTLDACCVFNRNTPTTLNSNLNEILCKIQERHFNKETRDLFGELIRSDLGYCSHLRKTTVILMCNSPLKPSTLFQPLYPFGSPRNFPRRSPRWQVNTLCTQLRSWTLLMSETLSSK